MSGPELLAHGCPNGHYTSPGHGHCPTCRECQTETVDLSARTATVLTWTESTATPSGVRSPNTLAVVAFEVGATTVRVLGGTTGPVDIGDTVEPVAVEQLRDPSVMFRHPDGQPVAGYRFQPVTDE